jgi:hypothetical protein
MVTRQRKVTPTQRRRNLRRSQSRALVISGALVATGYCVATPPIAPMFSAYSAARSRI